MLIPRFDVSQMVKRGKRKIRSKTARAMLDMGTLPLSTAFAVCLKVVSTHGCSVIVTEEPYTSKTCGCCGQLHQKLGGSKLFHCPACGSVFDRDSNGARNILLRYLTHYQQHIREQRVICLTRLVGALPLHGFFVVSPYYV